MDKKHKVQLLSSNYNHLEISVVYVNKKRKKLSGWEH